jgi:parvulin-like peptidyl-prolyl isomerase
MANRPQSGLVASPSGIVIERGRAAARPIAGQNGPSRSKPPYGCHIHPEAEAVAPQVAPAEVAQARLFEIILQAELHRLQDDLVEKLATSQATKHGSDDQLTDEELAQRNADIEEVNQLLKALRYRFLQAETTGAPKEPGVPAAHDVGFTHRRQ